MSSLTSILQTLIFNIGSEKKKIQKTVAEEKAKQPQLQLPDGKTQEDLRAIVKLAREQPTPTAPQELQAYFQVAMSEAEKLLLRGIPDPSFCVICIKY